MKHLIIGLMAVGLMALTGVQAWSAGNGPSAEAVESEFRFDPVPEGATVTHVYTIRNQGNQTLNVVSVKTG